MKHIYLILAAMMLLCLAPMPYGYFQLVRFLATVAFGIMAYQYYMKRKTVAALSSLPQRFVLPSTRKAHCGRVYDRVFREQGLDVICKGVGRMNRVEPVGDIAEMGIELVWGELPIGYPSVGKPAGEAGVDNDSGIPKTGVVCTDVTDYGDTAQPTAHIFKLRDAKTTTDSFFGSTIDHVAVKFGECSHRGNLHRFPYWRHGWHIVFLEMLLDKLIFRTIQLFLEVSEVSRKQIAVFCQSRVHKPEGTMPFCKDANHSGSDCNLNLLNGVKEKYAQLFVKVIKTQYLGESRTGLENVSLSVSLHQSPVACQTKIVDNVKSTFGFFLVFYKKPSLLQNVNLLLEREQLLGVSHNRINKKCPALVRCIPCGREALAGSIGGKGTTFNRNFQMIWRKSA
jgi:hypothetical protein